VTTEPERSAGRIRRWVRRRSVIVSAVVVAAAGAAIGVGASAGGHPSSSTPVFSDPMASALMEAGTAGLVAIPMGHLDGPQNTFWQLIRVSRARKRGPVSLTLATPKGVADNGGLLLAAGPKQLLVGFGPSGLLAFSPVAVSNDGGRHFSSGLIDQALEKVPDALAPLADGRFAALTALAGGTVLLSTGSVTSWRAVATERSLAENRSARSCGLTALTAIAAGPNGALLLGGRCARASAPALFSLSSAGRVTSIPVSAPSGGPSEVLRFGSGEALVERLKGGSASFVAVPLSGSATSEPLTPGSGDRLVATSALGGAESGFLVLVQTPSGRLSLEELRASTAPVNLPLPPPGTVFVAGSLLGGLTAYAVHASTLVVWATTPGGDRWRSVARLVVPILYGSSG